YRKNRTRYCGVFVTSVSQISLCGITSMQAMRGTIMPRYITESNIAGIFVTGLTRLAFFGHYLDETRCVCNARSWPSPDLSDCANSRIRVRISRLYRD